MGKTTVNGSIGGGRGSTLAAPSGRLIFARGAAGVTLHADPALPQFYQARCEHHVPMVDVHDSTVTMQYRHVPLVGWLVYAAHEPLADITLNGSIPWEIEVRGGASKLVADLQGLQLGALDVLGGANHVALTLPAPTGVVFMHIAGGVRDLLIHRPPGAALRLQVHGGVSNLAFDGRHVGAVGASQHWESAGVAGVTDRYDISIGGGASNVTITQRNARS